MPRVLRVLVIDDNADACRSQAVLLRLWGHEAFTAGDGSSALQVVDSQPVDVILMDLGLPGLDGFALAEMLLEELPQKPFLIALTGYADKQMAERCRTFGFDAFFAKPVGLQRLQDLLKQLGSRP